jgi:hypothetical protein
MGTNRQKDDFYPTPPEATTALLNSEDFSDGTIWECACGNGAMSKVLKENGYKVYSSDLNDYGFGLSHVDYLMTVKPDDNITSVVTNPPYKLAKEFILRTLAFNIQKSAFLLRLSFLESMRRYDQLFHDNPPIRVHVFKKRLTIWRGDEERAGNGTVAYAWFVWEKGFSGNPEIFWI